MRNKKVHVYLVSSQPYHNCGSQNATAVRSKMAAACKYFEEDAVYRINKKGNISFGLVLENSEFVSSDEEEDEGRDSKDDDWEKMKKGHVRVAWHPRGEEEVLLEKKVCLADRSLMPGDVVRRVIKGKDTQRGYCRNVYVKSSVQIIGSRQVIYNVSSEDLTPLEEFSVDIAVFLDSWVGMVKMVKVKIYLKCMDGSRCILTGDEASELEDVLDKRDRGSEFRKYDFYPGQRLWGAVRCFENAEWLHQTEEMKLLKSKSHKNIRATVENVKVVAMDVNWQCRAYTKDGSSSFDEQQPQYLIQGEDLKRVKMLNVFEPCTLQLGDRNYYVIKDSDLILSKDQWRRLEKNMLHDSKMNMNVASEVKLQNGDFTTISTEDSDQNKNMSLDNSELADENDSEFEDIDDENTSDTASISSRSSASSIGLVKKARSRPTLVTKVLKNKKLKRARKRAVPEVVTVQPGDCVAVETLFTSSSAEVVWQDGVVENEVPSTNLYPIHHLDDQEFFPGDFVVENRDNLNPHGYGVVKLVDHSGRTALVQWLKTYTEGADPHPIILNEEEVSVYDLKDHPDFKYRPGSVVIRVANFESDDPQSTAGQVLDVHPTGLVEVSWVNSRRSFCYPQDLYKVGEYDSDDGELWDDGDNSDDSWETESELSVIAEDQNEFEDDKTLRPKLAANIEKARSAMARLEEIFTQNPALQTSSVMKLLLEVYKDCKYLDRLMCTAFFHESHFKGLLEKVRERGCINTAQKVAEQVSRLFKASPEQADQGSPEASTASSSNSGPKLESRTLQKPSSNSAVGPKGSQCPLPTIRDECNSDSSNTNLPATHICANLCSLLKSQLLKAHEEVMKRFGGQACDGQTLSTDNSTESSPSKEEEMNSVVVQPPIAAAAAAVVAVGIEDKEVEDLNLPVVLGSFSIVDSAPDCHKFKLSMFQPSDPKTFFKSVRKEMKLLQSSLPEGIVVKGFEDRMDLFSVMIPGPCRTPYEDGLFFFDVQLSTDYPKTPPVCHYISYCSDRLNPNLYEDGKVCVSLLGTWGGKGTEMWTVGSNLLQVIVSIQGLILVSEPYFNEAGYERQKGTQQGRENSRMYNEMVILKLVQAMTKMIRNPPEIFRSEIMDHLHKNAYRFIHQLQKWLEISETYNATHPTSPTTPTAFREVHGEVVARAVDIVLPEFPLIPASKGFCITLHKTLSTFKDVLASVGVYNSL